MKKRLIDIVVAFMFGLSIFLFFGAYTRDWTESTPTDATVANQIDDFNRYLRVDTAERLEDYIAGLNSSDANEGFYHILFLERAASLSTPAANKYLLYGLLADGKCELVGEDEDGDMIQLSYTGKHMIGSGTAPQAFQYNTTEEDTDGGRESTIRVKGEQSGGEVTTLGYTEISHDGASDDQKGRYRIMLNDGDDSDAPSKCPIEYAADGTIDVTNSVSVLDEDAMGSDSATKVATQQSIKAFNTMVPAVTGASAGYAAEESVTFANGLIIKMGRAESTTDSEETFTFGTAFPNAIVCVVITRELANQTTPLGPSEAPTTTSFKIDRDSMTNCYFDWMAIGY